MKITNIEELKQIASNIRKNIIKQVYEAKSGHPGGSLSCTDILVVLYHEIMNLDTDIYGKRIDKFILIDVNFEVCYIFGMMIGACLYE